MPCDLLPAERPGPHVVGDSATVQHDVSVRENRRICLHPPLHLYLASRENGAAGDRWANLGHAAAFFLDLPRAPMAAMPGTS